MFCKQCGKPIDDGQELCEDCKNAANQNANMNNNMNMNNGGNYNNMNNGGNYNNMNGNMNNGGNYNNMNNNMNQSYNPQAKSKIAAGLLGIFLGALGVHNFYLGYTGKAVAQLLISILSCGTLSWASAIWGLVEGILILTGSINTDGNGNPLKD